MIDECRFEWLIEIEITFNPNKVNVTKVSIREGKRCLNVKSYPAKNGMLGGVWRWDKTFASGSLAVQ